MRSVKRASELFEKRRKLIKLADKSEAGWLAVDVYESDDLADDSADEKRIKRAKEKAVKNKKESSKSLASSTRSTRFTSSCRQNNLLFRGM